MTFQRKRGDVVFVLRHQIHGLKPLGQWNFGGMKHCARAQRYLCSARRALPVFAFVGQKRGARFAATARANKPRRPTSVLKRCFTLRLGAKPLDECAQRHTGLELDRVLGHGNLLSIGHEEYSVPSGGSTRETVAEFRH